MILGSLFNIINWCIALSFNEVMTQDILLQRDMYFLILARNIFLFHLFLFGCCAKAENTITQCTGQSQPKLCRAQIVFTPSSDSFTRCNWSSGLKKFAKARKIWYLRISLVQKSLRWVHFEEKNTFRIEYALDQKSLCHKYCINFLAKLDQSNFCPPRPPSPRPISKMKVMIMTIMMLTTTMMAV